MACPDTVPNSWRTLAPGGNFPGVARVWQSLTSSQRSLEQLLSERYRDAAVTCYASGTAALYQLLCHLKQTDGVTSVSIAGFTCPDIALAAARAGLKIQLIDLDRRTTELVPTDDISRESALILSNLFGLPDDIRPWSTRVETIVDDACQSARSTDPRSDNAAFVGARTSHGVFSFGRGKALCGVGGGAVTSSTMPNDTAVKPGIAAGFCDLGKYVAARVFERPMLYPVIARLPWLHLGETLVRSSIDVAGMSSVAASVATAQLDDVERSNQVFVDCSRSWAEQLSGLDLVQPFIERGFAFDGSVVPLRYPVLLPSGATSTAVLEKLTRAGLGASASYRRTLNEFGELAPWIAKNDLPGATDVSRRLITLPVHHFVRPVDIERSVQIIKATIN